MTIPVIMANFTCRPWRSHPVSCGVPIALSLMARILSVSCACHTSR